MAQELYISTLFRYNLKYAKKLEPDDIYILSAKHGLVTLDQIIDPYEQTLNRMRQHEIKAWAERILMQLQQACSINETEFIILAGEKYRKHLLPNFKSYRIPLQGLPIGKQIKKLKEMTS